MQTNNKNNNSFFQRLANFFTGTTEKESILLNGNQHSMKSHILNLQNKVILLKEEREGKSDHQSQANLNRLAAMDEKINAFEQNIAELKSNKVVKAVKNFFSR